MPQAERRRVNCMKNFHELPPAGAAFPIALAVIGKSPDASPIAASAAVRNDRREMDHGPDQQNGAGEPCELLEDVGLRMLQSHLLFLPDALAFPN